LDNTLLEKVGFVGIAQNQFFYLWPIAATTVHVGVHIVLQQLDEFIFSDFVLELEMQVMHARDIIAKGFVWSFLAFH